MKNLVLLVSAFVLFSCSTFDAVRYLADSSGSKSTSASDQAQAAPDKSSKSSGLDAAALAEWNKYSNPASSGKTFGAGADLSAASSAPVSLKGGEWAVYRSLENGKVKGVIKMALIGQDGDSWIYEFVSYTEKEAAVIQEAVKGLDEMVKTGNSDKGQVVWIKVKGNDGKIQTLDGAMLGMAGNSYKAMITSTVAHPSSAITAGGSITVPAGTFSSTWKADSQVASGRSSESGSVWVSTLVPLWHMIKAVGKSGHVMELVDFGTSGYQSALK